MGKISIKKIIQRDQEISDILDQMIEQAQSKIVITDKKNKPLKGVLTPLDKVFVKIEHEGNVIGSIYGGPSAKPIADFVQFLVRKENERRTLGSEVLDLYKEVNLMYNFTSKLAKVIDQEEISQLTLEEAISLIASDGGLVISSDNDSNGSRILASFGTETALKGNIKTLDNFYKKLLEKETGGIINDHKGVDDQVTSILYSPLKTQKHNLGVIILTCQEENKYIAADLKLLSTLSLQSAAAIESARLFEKNIRDAREKEAAIRALHEVTSLFVPNEFIKNLGYNQITDVTLGDSVEKEVTVVFSDIRGFTSLSENMSPEESFEFVNALNQRIGPSISNQNGFINQYLGDGIMAIFPQKSEDALKAAISIQRNLQEHNNETARIKKDSIRMGIGMHSGSLIMGIIGDEQRMDAAIIADTVNTASRIESLTKHYGVSILISEAVYNGFNAPGQFNLRYLGKVQVKGRENFLKIYECIDGDVPQQFDLKMNTITEFESGIQYYQNKEFNHAVNCFEAILDKNNADVTTRMFLQKSSYFLKNGVEDNWNGIEKMGAK